MCTANVNIESICVYNNVMLALIFGVEIESKEDVF